MAYFFLPALELSFAAVDAPVLLSAFDPDVFDALASKRSYKEAWSIDEAFAELKRITGEELDSDCVDALLKNRGAIERIQTLFVDPE